jgi:hypothetical protein
MTNLFGILGTVLGSLAIACTAAAFVCAEMNLDDDHWWCPLCQLRMAVNVAKSLGRKSIKRRRFRRRFSRRNP